VVGVMPSSWARLTPVTDRELEVLVVFCEAEGVKGAADRLGLSHHTVKNVLANVRAKLGVSTTAAAVYRLRERLE
jgi:DNA-binding NarL/FixJ family response regulator